MIKNIKNSLLVAAIYFLSLAAFSQSVTSTNASGGVNTTTNLIANNPFTATTTVSNVVVSVPAGVKQVATDGYNVFKNFALTNPISINVIGLKNGSMYGFGLEANTINTNSVVNVGFGVFGIQTQTKNAQGQSVKGWNFYDATLNLSVSQVENVPILNLPIILRIFSGPFASLNGGVLIGEQSGVTGDFSFEPWKNVYIDVGGGIVNVAGAAAANLQPVLPMAHAGVTFTF